MLRTGSLMKELTLTYNLDSDMRAADGAVRFEEDGHITVTLDGGELLSLDARQCDEIVVSAGVGCGVLFA